MEATALTNANVATLESIAALEAQIAELTRIANDLKVVAKLEQSSWPIAGSLNHTREVVQQAINHWSFVK